MRVLALALLAGLTATAALAADPPSLGNEVAPVTVMPHTEHPKLVSSFPAAGQALSPGVLVLRITFDQQMLMTGFNFAAAPGGEMPECLKTPRLLNDAKSFVLLCRTQPGKTYAIAFNAAPVGGFENVGENPAAPATLAFTTTTGDPVRTIEDAQKAANLGPLDMPVQDTPDLAAAPQPPPPPATAPAPSPSMAAAVIPSKAGVTLPPKRRAMTPNPAKLDPR